MYYIYRHTNKHNGKLYIGQTRQTPEKRWGNGLKYNSMLRNDALKYGWKDGFSHDIIMECETKELADMYEIYYIAFYQSDKLGYNILPGGDCLPEHMYGHKARGEKFMSVFNVTKKREVFVGCKKDVISYIKKNIILDPKLKSSDIMNMHRRREIFQSELCEDMFIIKSAHRKRAYKFQTVS